MGLEIERRFLVAGEDWRAHVLWEQSLRQGYLVASADGVTLRVRSGGEAGAWLTIKAPAEGIARHEFEYSIPASDGEALLALAPVGLEKRRYGLDLPGGGWVLDCFEGGNAPLVIAEVELERANQPLALPPWCTEEITGRGELSNAALARQPLEHWPEPDRSRIFERLRPGR